jgi:hypothetical protein
MASGNHSISLIWYRPKTTRSVLLLARKAGAKEMPAAKGHMFVLGYVIHSSTGQTYQAGGHQDLIDTNTGSRVLKVIGGLSVRKRYRFSISAVNAEGAGPAVRTDRAAPGP